MLPVIQSISEVAEFIKNKWGTLDVLINNAGIGFMGPLELAKPEHIKKAWETNVFGLMRTTQSFIGLLKTSNSARIINIGSIGGKMGLPYRGWYSAAKGSLEILGESLSIELKPFGIQVCTLLPGDVRTDIAESRLETPTEELGEYKNDYLRMSEILAEEMKSAMIPEKIALAVNSLLLKREMPLKKTVGSFYIKSLRLLKFNSTKVVSKIDYQTL